MLAATLVGVAFVPLFFRWVSGGGPEPEEQAVPEAGGEEEGEREVRDERERSAA
jgi:hypothetical protein